MATINLNNRTGNGSGSAEERVVIPTDTYRMKCIESALEDDTFAAPDKNGVFPQKIVTVWEIKAFGPSKLQEFIDALRAQGYLGDFNDVRP